MVIRNEDMGINKGLKQGCPNSVLEGRCPVEFSSNLPPHTYMDVSSSKSLISCFRLRLGFDSLGMNAHTIFYVVMYCYAVSLCLCHIMICNCIHLVFNFVSELGKCLLSNLIDYLSWLFVIM